MTREDVIRMAREADIHVYEGNTFADDMYISVLYRFANVVAAAEREACAQIADEEAQLFGITDDVVAHRIRARGEE